ncbi:MAG: histidine kinase [Opitutaceae bacterium]|jgi:signal transduction histidine kinase
MSIKLRFALLLGLLLLIFLGSLAVLRYLEKDQLTEALATSQRDASGMLERWLDLNGSSLRQFAEDYSRWDDMVTFVKKRDAAWADINLHESLAGFNAHDVWVLDTDGSSIYGASHTNEAPPPPLTAEEWRRLLSDSPFPHFYVKNATGLLEIRAAPIQPTDDTARKSPANGWFVVSRLWDDNHLKALGSLTESTINLDKQNLPTPGTKENSQLTLIRPLNDWRGSTVSILYVTRAMPAIAQRLRTDAFEARVFIIFGLLVMAALGLCLHNWVLKPLNAIGESLARQDAAPLQPLIAQDNELSHIASRIEISFIQQNELRREVDERARLGRDLHDGIIQSIYAAGMGLAAARTLIAKQPDEAAARIDQVRSALNETIRDVRNFITGLEPESLQSRSFTAAVSGLFEFLQSVGPTTGALDIHEAVADRLHLVARSGALQIIRECASNAVRHGHAQHVQVTLRVSDDGRAAILVISDDGDGFDLTTVNRGRGLNNITERARTLGANANITSEIGKGTRTTVLFPLSDLPA